MPVKIRMNLTNSSASIPMYTQQPHVPYRPKHFFKNSMIARIDESKSKCSSCSGVK